ncbi:MAG: type II toxin-antitoxin system VapC family toxin, partial [Pseudomonadota bacterium]
HDHPHPGKLPVDDFTGCLPMSFLIDTNVISEIRKGARCDQKVAAWYASIEDRDLYLSALTLGEIRRGIELARPRDPAKAEALQQWLNSVVSAFGNRIIAVDLAAGDEWGRMSAMSPA